MATLSGIHGRVGWPGHYTSHVFSWSMDAEAEMLEDTAWEFEAGGVPVEGSGSDGWKTFKAGLRGFSGSYECYQDEVPADFTAGVLAEIRLFVDAPDGAVWYGEALLGALHPEAPIDGMETVSIDFQGVFELSAIPIATTSTS